MLPFTTEVFFSNFAQYNAAIWPAQVVAYGLGLLALLLAMRPIRGSGRIVVAILAIFWAWTGLAYHLTYFATINFLAPVFGAAFVLQALLFAWAGAFRGRLAFAFRGI